QGQNGQSATLVVAAQGDMLEKARGAVKKVQAPAVSAHIDVPVAGFCKRSHLWRTEPQGVKRIVLDQVEETQVPVELADAALVSPNPIDPKLVDIYGPNRTAFKTVFVTDVGG